MRHLRNVCCPFKSHPPRWQKDLPVTVMKNKFISFYCTFPHNSWQVKKYCNCSSFSSTLTYAYQHTISMNTSCLWIVSGKSLPSMVQSIKGLVFYPGDWFCEALRCWQAASPLFIKVYWRCLWVCPSLSIWVLFSHGSFPFIGKLGSHFHWHSMPSYLHWCLE